MSEWLRVRNSTFMSSQLGLTCTFGEQAVIARDLSWALALTWVSPFVQHLFMAGGVMFVLNIHARGR